MCDRTDCTCTPRFSSPYEYELTNTAAEVAAALGFTAEDVLAAVQHVQQAYARRVDVLLYVDPHRTRVTNPLDPLGLRGLPWAVPTVQLPYPKPCPCAACTAAREGG